MAWLKKNIIGLPVFLWMAVLAGGPLIYVITLSFLTRAPDGGVIFRFTLANYERITDPVILGIFADSLRAAFFTSLFALLIGGPFAYFTAKLNKKTRFYVLVFVMIVFWTSSLIRTYGWIILLQTGGVFSTVLQFLGVISEPRRFMLSYPSVIAVTVYMFLPFMILPVYNAIEKIDPSLYEASYDLGAGKARTFFKITLPLSSAGIAGGVALVFIPSVGLYFISDLIGGARTMLLGNLIRNQMETARNWPFGAALSVVMLALLALFMIVYLLLSRDGGEGLF
ncbi:MAG: ABC transporter permease [Defluviitaleaceae bacterium]|nr:ABC transporter permease [Defluviitaleaceae bacterium]MCL2836748.1 ABC transporter permease [Defluviitaleaceae bacterium]